MTDALYLVSEGTFRVIIGLNSLRFAVFVREGNVMLALVWIDYDSRALFPMGSVYTENNEYADGRCTEPRIRPQIREEFRFD